jgi:hypothetical protein
MSLGGLRGQVFSFASKKQWLIQGGYEWPQIHSGHTARMLKMQ